MLVPADAPAVVTGASRGIGRAIALRLASAGRPVGLIARSRAALDAVAAEVRQQGVPAIAVACDMAEPNAVRAAADHLVTTLGAVRVLVNNAGVFLDRPVAETPLEEWERLIRVNLTGPFILTQRLWTHLADGRGGIVVNIASKAAVQGYVGQSAYCASKAGLAGWSRALALEGRPHRVRVHTICPGGVDTDLIAGTHAGDRMKGQPLMRPADIAEAVHFCLSQPANVDLPELILSRFAP